MTQAGTPTFANLMKLGRVHVSATVPEQSRQSLPVPVRLGETLQVAFFYCPSQALPGVVRMAPPHYLSRLDPATGALISLVPVTPATFHLAHPAREELGKYSLPQGMSVDQYFALRDRLFWLYDQLVPAFAQDTQSQRTDLKPLALEFLRGFEMVSEPPVRPYYDALGADYFRWLRAVSR